MNLRPGTLLQSRGWLVAVALGVAMSWSSAARAYSTLSGVSVTRSFAPAEATPGQVVAVTLTVQVGAIGADPLRGLFVTDHVPEALLPTAGLVQLDGATIAAVREADLASAIYPNHTSERWVLETAAAFAENHPVGAQSTLVVSYTVTVPANAPPGTISFPGSTWVAMIPSRGDAGDHFGFEDSAAALPVTAPSTDGDGDGMPDAWETAHGLDPASAADALLDPDQDQLANRAEYLNGTDPHDADSDDDLMSDGWEVAYGLDPLLDDAQADSDGDDHANLAEYLAGSDPTDPGSTPDNQRLLFDDFADGDDTSSPTWTHWSGQWTVTGGEYHQAEVQDNRFSVAGDPGWTDYRVATRIKLSGRAASGSGLIFRATDQDNFYLFEVDAGSATAKIWRRAAGTWTELAAAAAATPLSADAWHELAVTLSGTRMHAVVDAVQLIATTDDRHPAGLVGLDAGDEAWFDDVSVSRLSELPNLPPRATAAATPTAGDAPLSVAFTGVGADDDGTIVAYGWSLTDGATSSDQNPTHTFVTPGSFVATLTVTDDRGASASDSVTIMVYQPAPSVDGPAAPPAVGRGCVCTGGDSGGAGASLISLIVLGLGRRLRATPVARVVAGLLNRRSWSSRYAA